MWDGLYFVVREEGGKAISAVSAELCRIMGGVSAVTGIIGIVVCCGKASTKGEEKEAEGSEYVDEEEDISLAWRVLIWRIECFR